VLKNRRRSGASWYLSKKHTSFLKRHLATQLQEKSGLKIEIIRFQIVNLKRESSFDWLLASGREFGNANEFFLLQ
jgi:hypothetical protein